MTDEGPPESQHPLLVTTAWLADRLEGEDFALIDCGDPTAYRRAHIPGAVSPSRHPFLNRADGPQLVVGGEEFEQLARQLGVSSATPVVLYDDNASLHAARLWWVFELYGHTNVRILDGGFNAWINEGWPLTMEAPQPQPGSFTARVDDSHLCRLDVLKTTVEDGGAVQIWDTRSDAEWSGENDRGNRRAGHVPGAKHLEWSRLMEGPPTRRFRPLREIRELLLDAGINPEAETVSY